MEEEFGASTKVKMVEKLYKTHVYLEVDCDEVNGTKMIRWHPHCGIEIFSELGLQIRRVRLDLEVSKINPRCKGCKLDGFDLTSKTNPKMYSRKVCSRLSEPDLGLKSLQLKSSLKLG